MTEQNTTPTEETATSVETEETVPEVTGNKEAAKYRTQLREAEAARDTAKAQVTALQHQIIEANLAPTLKPEAWRLVHPDITDLLNEDGSVNMDAFKKAQTKAHKLLGIVDGPIVRNIGEEPTFRYNQGFEGAFAPRRN